MKKILLMMIGFATLVLADFSRDVNGVVTDSTTGLQWQDETNATAHDWEGAITYCENLELPTGVDDWRLPNLIELTSIVDDTLAFPSISSAFVYTDSNDTDFYWSSTTKDHDHSTAWVIPFNSGGHSSDYKSNVNKVRCVRGE